MSNTIDQIERYVQETMAQVVAPELKLAHDFKHVDRVRGWALRIAHAEVFPDSELVEASALLHDIGLAFIQERSRHAQVGAEAAARFLRERGLFTSAEIEAIAEAIRCHSSTSGGGALGAILRDADILDLLGVVGIMRACISQFAKPEYDPRDVKGTTWGLSADGFTKRFAAGAGIGVYIVDQINFQISCFDHLQTETARRLAQPLVDVMKAYLMQLEVETTAARFGSGQHTTQQPDV